MDLGSKRWKLELLTWILVCQLYNYNRVARVHATAESMTYTALFCFEGARRGHDPGGDVVLEKPDVLC